MMQSPRSLTATVHVRFYYDDQEAASGSKRQASDSESHTKIIADILDKASDMDLGLQELLVRFAEFLQQQRAETEG